jgi:aminopeptidase
MEHVETTSAYLALRGDDPDLLADIEATRVGDFLTPIRDLAKPLTPYLSRNYSNWCVACVSNPAWASKVLPDAPRDEQADRLWDLIFKACRMEAGDAVGTWRKHAAGLKKRATHMNNKAFDALRYSAPGTSLEVGLPAGHVWTGANMLAENGVSFIANIPTEEIFSLAHMWRVEGEVSSTKPLIYNGSVIDGIHLTFSEGRVVHASARIGQGTLEQLLRSDEGSTRLGEVALVPDSSPISRMGVTFQSTLYDENASSHLALGQAYRFTLKGSEMTSDEEFAKLGGNSSKVHVDFMVGSNQMEIDGLHADGTAEPIMRKGEWAFEV